MKTIDLTFSPNLAPYSLLDYGSSLCSMLYWGKEDLQFGDTVILYEGKFMVYKKAKGAVILKPC